MIQAVNTPINPSTHRPWAVQPSLAVLPSFVSTPLPLAEKLRHAHDDLHKTLKQLERSISQPQQRLYVNSLHVQLHTLDGLLKEAIDLLADADRAKSATPDSIPDSSLQEIRSLFISITAALEQVESWNRG
jgi:hypothetical protein